MPIGGWRMISTSSHCLKGSLRHTHCSWKLWREEWTLDWEAGGLASTSASVKVAQTSFSQILYFLNYKVRDLDQMRFFPLLKISFWVIF